MIRRGIRKIKRIFTHDNIKPVLGDKPFGGPEESEYTFVMIVNKGYNVNIPNANSSIRLGFCRGFEQIGIKYRIVSVYDLEKQIESFTSPIIFLSCYDYRDLSRSMRKKLRNYKHFVWGAPNTGVLQNIYKKLNYDYAEDFGKNIFSTVSSSEPDFIWAPVPKSALENYSQWRDYGCRLESIPLACDTEKYFPSAEKKKFPDMDDAVFVGGYWPKKAIQFDLYLRPIENILKVYGYSKWPYKGFCGLLVENRERELYFSAKVSPALSEPHAEFTGDIVERVYKIMGSGGLAVPDVNRFYAELFTKEELFIPATTSEYYDFIYTVLKDEELNRKYRTNGYKAVIEKHTYKIRALQIAGFLGIKI